MLSQSTLIVIHFHLGVKEAKSICHRQICMSFFNHYQAKSKDTFANLEYNFRLVHLLSSTDAVHQLGWMTL